MIFRICFDYSCLDSVNMSGFTIFHKIFRIQHFAYIPTYLEIKHKNNLGNCSIIILKTKSCLELGFFLWNHDQKDWTKFDKTGCRKTILVSSSPNMIHKKFLSDTQIAICPEIKMTTLWWQTSLRHFTPTVKKMWQKSSFGESTLEAKTF